MARARQALRQRREQGGWTQESFAFALGVATSTYKSWERGEKTPRVGYRPKLARLLDASLAQVEIYLDGQQMAAPDGHQVPAWLGHLASLEQGASSIWAFEPVVVHGLVQTATYAGAVERVGPASRPPEEEIAQRVKTRIARQGVLVRQPDPLALSVVLDESVLYRVAGDHQVMRRQLDHLAEMADRPNVDVRILSLTAGVFSAAFGAFQVLTSPGGSDPYMACVEDRAGPHYLDRPHEIEAHASLFEYLSGVALSPADSIDLLRSVSKERYQ